LKRAASLNFLFEHWFECHQFQSLDTGFKSGYCKNVTILGRKYSREIIALENLEASKRNKRFRLKSLKLPCDEILKRIIETAPMVTATRVSKILPDFIGIIVQFYDMLKVTVLK